MTIPSNRHEHSLEAGVESGLEIAGPDAQRRQVTTGRGELDDVPREPASINDIRQEATTIGPTAMGVLGTGEDDQARLRLHDVQVMLLAVGYPIGGRVELSQDIDSVWGEDTREAIAQFQEDHDMERSGQLDDNTYMAILAEYEQALGASAPEPDEEGASGGPLELEHPLDSKPNS